MSRHTEVKVDEVCTCDLFGKSIYSDVSTGSVSGMRQSVMIGDKYVDLAFDIKVFLFDQMQAQDLCYDCRKAILRKLAEL
jgi:hypothetical protein